MDNYFNYKLVLEKVKLLKSDIKEHSYRVAQLAYMNALQSKNADIAEYCYYLALVHDLYEDTDIDKYTFTGQFNNDLLLLTRDKNMTYFEYINEIHNKEKVSNAYIVKIADLIDHLTRRETLSESLLDRYEKAIKILVPELEGINLSEGSGINGTIADNN